jgi:CDP-6-deoxy-D-xylo-4-hexulose-3-dehydrase
MRQTGEGYRIVGELKNTDFVMTNGFWIGVFPGMTKEMNLWMIKCIREFCIAHAK